MGMQSTEIIDGKGLRVPLERMAKELAKKLNFVAFFYFDCPRTYKDLKPAQNKLSLYGN